MEDWGEEIFAEGVGVKWKKWVSGEEEGKCLTATPPPSAPTLHRSSIQLRSKIVASKTALIFLAFRSKITPAPQAKQRRNEALLRVLCVVRFDNMAPLSKDTRGFRVLLTSIFSKMNCNLFDAKKQSPYLSLLQTKTIQNPYL